MAFQAGSQVRPELGRIDYSGFTQAAGIEAQALANLGSMIGGAIVEGAKKKKENEKLKLATASVTNVLQDNPYARMMFGIPEGTEVTEDVVKPIVKAYGTEESLGLTTKLNLALIEAMIDDDDKVKPTTVLKADELLDLQGFKVTGSGQIKEKGFGGKILQETDPRFQRLMEVEGMDELAFGYDTLEFLGTE